MPSHNENNATTGDRHPIGSSAATAATAAANDASAANAQGTNTQRTNNQGNNSQRVKDEINSILASIFSRPFIPSNPSIALDDGVPAGGITSGDSKNTADDDANLGLLNNVVVPYGGEDGKFYTLNTPPSACKDWASYMVLCFQGPRLRIRCPNEFDDNGKPISYFETFVNKKLLLDHSDYFQAMFRCGMIESRTNCVVYEDILIEDFMRLYLFVMAGGPSTRSVIGLPTELMSNLLNSYIMADRFQMPQVREWIHRSILDAMQQTAGWKDLYAAQAAQALQSPPADGAAAAHPAASFHTDRIADWSSFHLTQKELPRELRPISMPQFLDYFLDHCPGEALDDAWPQLDDEFRIDVGQALVRKHMLPRP